ncbi:MAG: hypothetical protein PVG30_01345 [Gammaproteobacteria bacterium]|jgi:hypothetical protein
MYTDDNKQLFKDGRLYDHLQGLENKIRSDIDHMTSNYFRANTDEEVVKHFKNKYSVTPLVLDVDNKTLEDSETTVDVSRDPMRNPFGDRQCTTKGMRLMLTMPYSGDSCLWNLQPDSYSFNHSNRQKAITKPHGDIPGSLTITFEYIQDQARTEQIKSDINSEISLIQTNVDSQKGQIIRYHNNLEKFIMECIGKRKNALKQRNIILDGLDIPLKPKADMPDIEPIQVKKRIVPLKLKSQPLTLNTVPEPGISEEIFLDIIAILRFMGRTFEETSKTFAKLEEEDLRNVFLAALNGYFEGEASGEIFRKNGKTDICIKEKEKAAFVAECKIWHGEKAAGEALNQLLGYLTWRDCKTSLIVLNKGETAFSKVLTSLPEAIRQHKLFVKELTKPKHEGEWKFIIKHKDDDERYITLHVFAFDL